MHFGLVVTSPDCSDLACLPEADLFIPGSDILGQHVQARNNVLEAYYHPGHWGYICMWGGGGGINQAVCVCVCWYAMHCTLCMSYTSPLSILGYFF